LKVKILSSKETLEMAGPFWKGKFEVFEYKNIHLDHKPDGSSWRTVSGLSERRKQWNG